MLLEFQVENFLSWVNLSFKPKDVNLLIGLNNTGKTNLCNALRFISQTSFIKLDNAVAPYLTGKSGITNFSYKSPETHFKIKAVVPYYETKIEYEYELTILSTPPDSPKPSIKIGYEKLKYIDTLSEEHILIESEQNNVTLLNESNNEKTTSIPPQDSTMLFQLYENPDHAIAVNFKKYLRTWLYYDLSTEGLRQFNYNQNDFWLYADGSNLSSVIYNLKKTDERRYRALIGYLQIVEPDVRYINFSGGDTAEPNIFMYFEYESGDSFPAWRASNGTLSFLALSYILTIQPGSFLIIEEPENGIYVGYFKKLLNLISENKNNQQTLFSTHSPYFIDLFDDKLENIFVSKKDHYRSTLSMIDIKKAEKNLKDFPLGEQHFREILFK